MLVDSAQLADIVKTISARTAYNAGKFGGRYWEENIYRYCWAGEQSRWPDRPCTAGSQPEITDVRSKLKDWWPSSGDIECF